jgi:NTP pyrophosphatase (non-canonical NTP hydrolase)
MDAKEYKQKALRTESNDFSSIKSRMAGSDSIRLLHAAMGMQTEVAEFTDMLKKHIFYGKPLDVVNLKEELFDTTWYMAIALDVLEGSFEAGFERNIEKLKARYPDKFTEELAENRDLDKEREILENE